MTPKRKIVTLPSVVSEVVPLRESSVVTLASHGLLSARQVAAAFRFRNEWDTFERDSSAAHYGSLVDHARSRLERAERESTARRELKRARALLGAHGFSMLIKVCGEGFSLREMYPASRRERDTMTDMLRLHLDMLATMWGEP